MYERTVGSCGDWFLGERRLRSLYREEKALQRYQDSTVFTNYGLVMNEEMVEAREAVLTGKMKVIDRVADLENKKGAGTLSSGSCHDGIITNDEYIELEMLKEHWNLEIFDEVVEMIQMGRFDTIKELLNFLYANIYVPEKEDNLSDDNINIEKIRKEESQRIVTYTEIYYLIDEIFDDHEKV